ncbi:DNA polymerase III subunit alpha [Desulfosediminicola sp.]|uniref:DNA polymerase III subunit alpha n=1 Tax=Desulfosediminicola sp. TaxID=2886825 RepID=UPI003AF1F8C3
MFCLRVRSSYSLSLATAMPETLCELAVRFGYSGLAITDRDNLYGLWNFLKSAKQQGLRPIVGVELSEPDSERLVVCLVENNTGYSNLCKLITSRHCNKNFCFEDALPGAGAGLLILGRDIGLLDELRNRNVEVAADLGPRPTEQARMLRQWANDAGVPAVITAESSLAHEGERQLYQLLRAIAANTSMSRLEQLESLENVFALEPVEKYRQRFGIWPEVLTATEALADRCRFTGPEFGIVMPPWREPELGDAATVLRARTYLGARLRYGDDLGEPVVERLEHELKVIEEMGFSSYFLVVRDIVHRKGPDGTRKKRRICGRGSGAASLVAYCLEITNVCPLKYNLYFERFLNPGRSDPPDIDVDFSWDERDEVLNEVLSDFSGYSAMVCNHIFFQPRMAIRETAKAFGMPGYEISRLTKRLHWLHGGNEDTIIERIRTLPSLKDQDFSDPWPEIFCLAGQLVGLPRYLSVHPGGVVITPKPINEYVPVQYAAKGVPIIQWEKDSTEEAGLVKIDILGNRSLGVIRDAVQSVSEGGIELDEMTWNPEDDVRTRSGVARGTTMGCFYIESPAMRLLQQKAATGDFEQLVIQSSIIRPAANDFVREYVRRLHGGAWQPLHPLVGDVLDETFGLMVYQEDVSRVAVALAGFSHARADGLRKVMSKKDKELRLHDYRERFYSGCRERDIAEKDIDQVWEMIMSFSGYSFCKPHSASYARVSYQAAYLKHHHPAEFMAAVISNQGGYYSTMAYVSEAKRLGLEILHPDVNHSRYRWQGNSTKIRVGLQAIHGLSEKLVTRLLVERNKGDFSSPLDFWNRVVPAEDEGRALIHAGAMDSLDPQLNRTALLWQWAAFQRSRVLSRTSSLFPVQLPPPPALQPPDLGSQMRREYELLGFLCRHHPITFMGRAPQGVVKMEEVAAHVGRRIRCVGWLLTGKIVSTKTGEAMEFLTFEDETGIQETTFFPKVYKRAAHLLQSGRAYILTGLVEEDYGAVTLTVENIQPLVQAKKR